MSNIRLEQTAGKSRFNVKVCKRPDQHRAAAQAGRYILIMTDHILFKFRSVNKYLLQSIVQSELHFAHPACLNDPFDCKVDIRQSLEVAISKTFSTVRERLEKFRGLNDFLVKLQSDIAAMGVCSFSCPLDGSNVLLENPLMWSHYADAHRGVCLTYRFSEQFFYDNADQILGIAEVDYGANPLADWFVENIERFNDFTDFGISLLKKVLTVKSSEWQYEKEVRILRKVDGSYPIGKQHLVQVCFGLKTPETDIDLIKNLLSQGQYEVQLFRLTRSDDADFGLNALEI